MNKSRNSPKKLRYIKQVFTLSVQAMIIGKVWPALFCLLLFATPSLSQAEWVEWIGDANISIQHNDNINRSAFNADVDKEGSLNSSFSFGRVYQASSTLRYSLKADLETALFDEYEKLNSTLFGVSALARKKFGLGLTVPWLSARVKAGYLDVRHDVRNGLNYEVDLQLGKRYSERLSVAAGFRYNMRDGKSAPAAVPDTEGRVFDQDSSEYYLLSSYLFTSRFLGSIGATYFYGDIDSACTPGNVGRVLTGTYVRSIIADEVFGGCIYRLKAKAYSLSLEGAFALDGHSSVGIGCQYQRGKSDTLKYRNTLFNISYMYSY